MKHVAVNTRLLLPGKLEGIGRFAHESLKEMARARPDLRFSFFFDRKHDPDFVYGENVRAYELFPQARHPVLYYWWFEWSVARMLRKLKPDIFFSPDGYLSLNADLPQVPVFHDLGFLHYPQDVTPLERKYYHYFFPRYAKKAARILTVSEFTKQDIIGQWRIRPDLIDVAYNGCGPQFHPVGEAEKKAVREKYAGGNPYFLYVGAIQPRKNIENLLLAFDYFKTQTEAPVQLLLTGRKAWRYAGVEAVYEAMRHKSDVRFTGFVPDEELNGLYAASTALCYVSRFEGFGLPVAEAMRAETAVVAGNAASLPEVAGEAALLADPENAEEIAGAMRSVYEDAELRNSLIEKGRAQSRKFVWEETARQVLETLEQAARQ